MGKTVAVVDYGMGNLRSVSQAVMHVADGSGFEVTMTSTPSPCATCITACDTERRLPMP